jgi:hypothetical protein
MDMLSASYIALFVTSDAVRFRDERGRAVELERVPAVVFSEAMREVDLFVSVASVGNDPNWMDGGGGDDRFRAYVTRFEEAELAESARTRRAVLEELLPLLSIADRCRLLERQLEVRGEYATYRIHLVSGHVHMEPGSRYLCIVPAGRARERDVALPFEGDSMLAVILSKAFLLADDVHIGDRSILQQIHGS